MKWKRKDREERKRNKGAESGKVGNGREKRKWEMDEENTIKGKIRIKKLCSNSMVRVRMWRKKEQERICREEKRTKEGSLIKR